MKFEDIGLAVVIILIFVGMYLFSILSVGMKKLKKDWPQYRCNPAVMPFAKQFGHDPVQNFTFCIGNIQKNMMGFFLAPIHYVLSLAGNLGGIITDAINEIRKLFSYLRTALDGVIGDIFGIFMNILIQVQRLVIQMKDLAMKILGVMTNLLYIMDSSMKLGESIWAGPLGEVVRALCFKPDTPVKLADGRTVPMSEVALGDVLSNGSRVRGVLKLKPGEKDVYYKLYSKELKDYIYVTGEHKIRSTENQRFIPVEDHPRAERTDIRGASMSCLITSDHLIPVGEYTFWDWED